MALSEGGADFKPGLFFAALAAMLCLHHGSNMLNDVIDFRRGTDREIKPTSGAVVRGWCAERDVERAGWTLMALGAGLGLAIACIVGWPILVIGAVGVFFGVVYTWPPLSLKYRGWGDAVVFLNFGVLGALGAWIVQTGRFSWIPIIWAVPFSLLVTAVLHANNWRDAEKDRAAGVRTPAFRMGPRASACYYDMLLGGAFISTILLVACRLSAGAAWGMPVSMLAVLPAMPMAFRLHRKGVVHNELMTLDADTAKMSVLFSVLSLAGLAAHMLWFS